MISTLLDVHLFCVIMIDSADIDGIDNSLESLCLRMTEQALSGEAAKTVID